MILPSVFPHRAIFLSFFLSPSSAASKCCVRAAEATIAKEEKKEDISNARKGRERKKRAR
jgi:hypothetical protein